MGLNQRVKDGTPAFQGQKSGLPIDTYGIESGEQIENLVLKEGALQVTNGSKVYSADVDAAAPGAISSLHKYQNRVVAQKGAAVYLENAPSFKFFTLLQDRLSGVKLTSSVWRDRIYLTNTEETKYLLRRGTGAQTQQVFDDVGLDPPPNVLAYFGNGLGGWDYDYIPGPSYFQQPPTEDNQEIGSVPANIHYYYLITLYDEKTNTESPAGGALLGENGMYDLSPNSTLGPAPLFSKAGVRATNDKNGIVMQIPFGNATKGLGAYLRAAQARCPRATHFIVYRGTRNTQTASFDDGAPIWGDFGSRYSYNSFEQVPYSPTSYNLGDTLPGKVYVPIQAFINAGKPFIDNSAAPIPASLPENNSPPPTKRRALESWTEAANVRSLTSPAAPFDVASTSGFRHTRIFRDQLFGFGSKNPGYDVSEIRLGADQTATFSGRMGAYSDILHGSEVYQPDYITYLWEVGVGDGQDAVGLGVLGDLALLVFKTSSTYYLAGSSPDNYVLRVLDTNKGCLSEHTIQETSAGVLALDGSGFVLYNKVGQGERVSKKIQNLIQRINTSVANNFYSNYDPKEQRYYCAVALDAATVPNLTLCLDLATMEWTTVKGQEGLARLTDYSATGAVIDIVGSAVSGKLLDLTDSGQILFDGQPITSTWKSGTITFGDEQRKKKMQWLYLKARGMQDWTLDIEIIPDDDETRKYTVLGWSALASQSSWLASDMAAAGGQTQAAMTPTYAPTRRQSKIPISCIGYKFQVRITHRETDATRYGFALENISAEAVAMGR